MSRNSVLFSLVTNVLLVVVLLSASVDAVAGGADPTAALLLGHRTVDLAGEPVSLGDWPGEVLVVNFWASWCAPCLQELPQLDEWNTAWQGTGARVVAISIDQKPRNVRDFVARTGLELPVWVDGPDGLAQSLDLPAVPTTYVIDQQGQVVLRIEGSAPLALERLHHQVQALLAAANGRPKA